MNRLFDDVDDGNREQRLGSRKFQQRVTQAAARFAGKFGLPQIIALQEVENLNVLQQIALSLRQRHGIGYRGVLVEGQDVSSINIGFLVQESIEIRKVEQLFTGLLLPVDGSPLFSRPPLLLEACYRAHCLSLLNLHLRSMRGIDSASRGHRVAVKRQHQAEAIARWINRQQQVDPDARFLLLGDFNALTPSDSKVDVAGILRGSPDDSATRLASRDLLDPDLVDLTRRIPQRRRHSYIFRGRKQQLDYMFASAALVPALRRIEYSAIEYRFSDHAGLLAWFDW